MNFELLTQSGRSDKRKVRAVDGFLTSTLILFFILMVFMARQTLVLDIKYVWAILEIEIVLFGLVIKIHFLFGKRRENYQILNVVNESKGDQGRIGTIYINYGR